jgi:predicted transcriptional regulator
MGNVHLSKERKAKIDDLAQRSSLTADDVLAQIVDEYFAELEELRSLIDEGVADKEAGRVFTVEQVRERLSSYAAKVKLEDESA